MNTHITPRRARVGRPLRGLNLSAERGLKLSAERGLNLSAALRGVGVTFAIIGVAVAAWAGLTAEALAA